MCCDSPLKGLYCVGLGPGDPELITLKALRIIKQAPVILVPKGQVKVSIARRILMDLPEIGDCSGKLVEIEFSMALTETGRFSAWEKKLPEIDRYIDRYGAAVYVTLGDPSLYSTVFYLTETYKKLRPGIPVTFIPGISSIQDGAARIMRPLAWGNQPLYIGPLPGTEEEFHTVLDRNKNVVFMKIGKRMEEAVSWLRKRKDRSDVIFIGRSGLPGQKIIEGIELLEYETDGNLALLFIRVPGNDRIII